MTRHARIGFVLGAIAATCSIGVHAQSLPYTQSPGFYSGPTNASGAKQATMLNLTDGYSTLAGGLDFFPEVVPVPPAPANTYSTIGWGCPFPALAPEAVQLANCATNGALFPPPGFPAVTPWGSPFRSALQAFGGSGTLDINTFKVVTTINHQNQPIFGSRLTSAQVQSFLRLNGLCVDNVNPACTAPSLTNVAFTETDNVAGGVENCTISPDPGNAPVNPLGSQCDDFALVSGLDLAPLVLPIGSPWNPVNPAPGAINQDLVIDFRLSATAGSGALVCDGSPTQPADCDGYNGLIGGQPTIAVYTAEDRTNTFSIEARLRPYTDNPIPLFVIGDCEWDQSAPKNKWVMNDDGNNLREVGDVVNFWGAQWWKNNCMSNFNDQGYPAFKGFATNSVVDLSQVGGNCGTWQARPGNSGHPPETVPTDIAIIVTDRVNKDGPNIGGIIKELVIVHRDPSVGDNYAGNPGHRGWCTITSIVCAPN